MHKETAFIIPHKGREQYLIDTLKSIAEQEYDLSLISVIIVTQNESLSANIEDFAHHFDINVLYRPVSETISALRNHGAAHSDSKYFAFLDADIYLSKNWLKTMLDLLKQNPQRILVSAAQKNSEHPPPLEQIRTALSNTATDANVNFLPGRNLFLSRESFNRVDGFPEHLVTCEDYYFTDQLGKLGNLYYSSQADYIHLGEDKNYNEMFKKEIWRGQSNLKSIRGRNVPMSEIPSFIVPVIISLGLPGGVSAWIFGLEIFALLLIFPAVFLLMVYILRLYRISQKAIPFKYIAKFYLYYFPARTIGTIGGLFRSLKTQSHNR